MSPILTPRTPPAPRLPAQIPFPEVPIPTIAEDPALRTIIGNWNSINAHIKTKPSMRWFEVAMNLESQRPGGPRKEVIERLYAKWVKHHRAGLYACLQIPNPKPGV
jgi:hypothetical protein